jgi:hypothetical protein
LFRPPIFWAVSLVWNPRRFGSWIFIFQDISYPLTQKARLLSFFLSLHVVCGRFSKYAVYWHSHATISQYYQANALSICTKIIKKPKITNIEIANQVCRICKKFIIALKNVK